jgi:hypothetical protein
MIQEDLFLDQSYILDNGLISCNNEKVEKTILKHFGYTVTIYIVQLPNGLWCSTYDIDSDHWCACAPLRPYKHHEATKEWAVFDVYYRVINQLNLVKEKKNVLTLIEKIQNEYMKK